MSTWSLCPAIIDDVAFVFMVSWWMLPLALSLHSEQGFGFFVCVERDTLPSDFCLHLIDQNCATYLSSDYLLAKGNEMPMTGLDQSGFLSWIL